jgi:iron complex outermembrane receptor protein
VIRSFLYKAASFCCLFFILLITNSQEKVNLELRVVDDETGKGIPYLRAEYKPSIIVFSDEDGHLSIANFQVSDTLIISGMGYGYNIYPASQIKFSEDLSQLEKVMEIRLRRPNMELAEVNITGFRKNALNMSTAAAIGIIQAEALKSNDQSSLQNAVNMIPGVSMESRGYGGSQRINIRGSFLRAPFAVRNVKMYMEGIPLSSPDGSSPLELMDAFDVGRIEIIKGQGGSLYGSGTGGVMLFSLPIRNNDPDMSIQNNYTSGAFGLKRSATAYQVKLKNSRLRISHVYQENDGYRIQEFNRKQQLTLMLQTSDPEKKTSNFIYASYFNGHLGLPGGLNAAQIEEDPMQANLFSALNNASLYRERLNLGVSGKMPVSKSWDYEGSAYFNLTNKQNPFGTSSVNNGYKDEKAWGYGARGVFSNSVIKKENVKLNLSLGIEHQYENFTIVEYANVGGPARR